MIMIRRILAPAVGVVVSAAFLATATAQRRPAPNLTKPVSVEKAPDTDGFIQRWLVLEPILIRSNAQLNDSFVQKTIKTEYFPDQYTMIPRDGDKVPVNGSELMWHAVDTSVYHVNL